MECASVPHVTGYAKTNHFAHGKIDFVIIRQIWVWSITRENLEAITCIVSEIRDLEPCPCVTFRFRENERYCVATRSPYSSALQN